MIKRKIYRKSLWIQLLLLCIVSLFVYAEDAEEWIPDANLQQTVSEALELTADEPLTKEKMLQLTKLHA